MKVGPIAWTEYAAVGPHDSVASVEEKLIRDKFLVVKDNDRYVGILTVSDTVAKPHVLTIDCIRPKPETDYHDSVERTLQRMEGEKYDFLPVFRSGQFYGVVSYKGIAQALREQREASRRREQTHLSKIEQFEAMRGLAGGVAHDFNNLIQTILWSLDTIVEDQAISESSRKHAERAAQAASAASDLAGQLMSFSRHGALIRERTDIAAFIEENARFVARGHNLELEISIPSALGEANLSRAQFARVVHNLVLNAAHALSDSGGRLRISGKVVDHTCEVGLPVCPGTYLRITFQDNGPGIAPEHLPHIFDPYFTTKPTGTGLGLAIVYTVVTDHGGYVTVDSKKGHGSKFNIFLPCVLPDCR